MTPLTIESLSKTIADFKAANPDPIAVGVVVRVDLKKRFLANINEVKPEDQRGFSTVIGTEIHFIENQTEDALVFHDRTALSNYLKQKQIEEHNQRINRASAPASGEAIGADAKAEGGQ